MPDREPARIPRERYGVANARSVSPVQASHRNIERCAYQTNILPAGIEIPNHRSVYINPRTRETHGGCAFNHVAGGHELSIANVESSARASGRRDQNRAGNHLRCRIREIASRRRGHVRRSITGSGQRAPQLRQHPLIPSRVQMGAGGSRARAVTRGLITKVGTDQSLRIAGIAEGIPHLVSNRRTCCVLIRTGSRLMDIPQLATRESMPAGRRCGAWRRRCRWNRRRRCRWNRRRRPCRHGGWRGSVVQQWHIDADVTVAECARAAAPAHIERDCAKRGPRATAWTSADIQPEIIAHALPDANLDRGVLTLSRHANCDVSVAIGTRITDAGHGDGDRPQRSPTATFRASGDVERLRVADALPDAHLDRGRAPRLREGDSRGRARESQHGEQCHDDPRYFLSPFVSVGTSISMNTRSPWIMAVECPRLPSSPFLLFPYLFSGRSSHE